MRKCKSKCVSILLAFCLILPFAGSIAALAADMPNNLTGDSNYLVIHEADGDYSDLGGPSEITVKDAGGSEISPVDNVYSDVPEGATIDLQYVFHLKDGNEGTINDYSGGKYFDITLPEGITFDQPDDAQPIMADDTTSGDKWQLGTWSFTDGHTIRVNISDAAKDHLGIWGLVGITGTFAALGNGDSTETQMDLGTQTIKFNRVPPQPLKIPLEKEGAYDSASNTITWKVTATPPDGVDLGGYSLVDTYSSNQDFKTGSFKVGETGIDDTGLDLTTANQITYTFPESTTGQQIITYQTQPNTFSDENGTSGKSIFTNTAIIKSGDDPVSDPATYSVTTDWISKTGKQVADGLIQWEVKATVPEGAENAYIEDSIPAGLQLVENDDAHPVALGTDTVPSGTGAGTYSYTYTDADSASQLICRLPADTTTAKLTYYTQVVDPNASLNSNDAVTFTNAATLHWDNMPDSSNAPGDTSTVTGVGAGGLLSKSSDGGESYVYPDTIKWTVTVNRNKITIKNAKVSDTVPEGQALLIDADHPFTVTDGTTPDTITSAATGGKFTYTSDNQFTYAFGDINSKYTITYYTKIVDINAGANNDTAGLDTLYTNGDVSFQNSATLSSDNSVEADKDATKTYSSQILDKSGSYDYSNHTAKWTIVVNRNRLPLTNAVVSDPQLPEGMTLLIDEDHPFTVTKRGEDTPVATAPTTGATNDTSFTCDLGTIDDQYTISFYTLLTDDALLQQGQSTKAYTNTAELTANQIPNKITASGTVSIKNPVITKTGPYNGKDDHIDWSVEINPGLLPLSGASVTDQLNEGLALDAASLKLYQVSVAADGTLGSTDSGTPVSESAYTVTLPTDENNNTLTLALPDGKAAYRLEFTTNILLDNRNFTNEITLSGSQSSPSGDASSNKIIISNLWSNGGSGSRTLTVHKTDSAGNPVAGATYQLLNLNKQPITRNGSAITAVTDDSGNAVFTNLPSWTFYAQETASPEGYLLNPEVFGGERLSSDLTYQTVDQLACGDVSFTKTSTGGAPLTGGVFTLTGQDYAGSTVTRTAASVSGTVTFQSIPLGSYSIKETTAPSGYNVSDTVITATVAYNETKTATVATVTPDTLQNVRKPSGGGGGTSYGSITLKKTDAAGAALEGAKFGLYNSAGKLIASAVSLSDGTVQFEDVPYGTYTIRETQAPTGYALSATEATAVVDASHSDAKASPYSIVNEKNGSLENGATIRIKKVDADTGAVLAGAEFTLYDTAGNAVQTAVSGSDGAAVFSGLAKGDYTIRETAAPKGYLVMKDALSVSADTEQSKEYTVQNTKNPDEIDINDGNSPTGSLNLGDGSTPTGSLNLGDGSTPTGSLNLEDGQTPKGTRLPQTGGFWDTDTLSLLGAALILLGVAVSFIRKRKRVKAHK